MRYENINSRFYTFLLCLALQIINTAVTLRGESSDDSNYPKNINFSLSPEDVF